MSKTLAKVYTLVSRVEVFSSRGLSAHGWTFVIDGSNFAFDNTGRADFDGLLTCYRALRSYFVGADFKIFCDASLRHKFEPAQRDRFDHRVKDSSPLFFQCPAGKTADEFMLRFASNRGRCVVVSNDTFNRPEEQHLRIGVAMLKVLVVGDDVLPAGRVDLFPDAGRPGYRVEIDVAEYMGGGR